MSQSFKAFDQQVGGDHYKVFKIQPSEYCEKNNLSHLQSQAIKYISRAGMKGPAIQDYEKAIHCLKMKIQLLEEENANV